MRVEVRLDSFVLRVRVLLAEGEEHRIHKERLGLYLYTHLSPRFPRHLTRLRSSARPVSNTSHAGGGSQVAIDEKNVLSIKGIGVLYPDLRHSPLLSPHRGLDRWSRCYFPPSPFFSHIAFRMAPGDMGSLVIRTPMAWEMALARAARGGMMGTSPTPRSPKGWRGLGTSTSTVSIMGMSRVVGMR